MASNPKPGDFGVVRTGGWAARLIRWGTESTVNHAFVYLGNGEIIEAEPKGARISKASKYPHALWSTGKIELVEGEGEWIAHYAKTLVGIPYNWLDIAAIGLAQRRLGRIVGLRSWIAHRLSDNGKLMCSQLVDFAYQHVCIDLFTDGRPCGMVSPGDLLTLIQ